jgi:hypothetical protein
MNASNLISRVASILGDRMDGDTLALIDTHLPDALKTASKLIALHKPVGHQKALFDLTQITSFTVTNDGSYTSCTFPTDAVELDRFHRIEGELFVDGIEPVTYYHDFQPVFAYHSLKLASIHGMSYYYVENDTIFLAPYVGGTSLDSVDIRHYKYMTITEFPDELADILVGELLKLLQREPTKQRQERIDKREI